jgi:NOL1/NOP2/fmu family ribosome biogenesis protein
MALGCLQVLQAGVPLAKRKGKAFQPDHRWVLSMAQRTGVFSKVELSYKQAIQYLRGESLVLNDAPLGYLLVCFQGAQLGFVKNVGNRANNLYPTEWRVKKSLYPEQ